MNIKFSLKYLLTFVIVVALSSTMMLGMDREVHRQRMHQNFQKREAVTHVGNKVRYCSTHSYPVENNGNSYEVYYTNETTNKNHDQYFPIQPFINNFLKPIFKNQNVSEEQLNSLGNRGIEFVLSLTKKEQTEGWDGAALVSNDGKNRLNITLLSEVKNNSQEMIIEDIENIEAGNLITPPVQPTELMQRIEIVIAQFRQNPKYQRYAISQNHTTRLFQFSELPVLLQICLIGSCSALFGMSVYKLICKLSQKVRKK